ncbi:MAG: LLM class flavin-dependent oxidoreductase [Gammaproteobacteria bacterium]|nr:LLM class flavin-dependent oxidoreductase [Gammaproteobacteria bacterium]
MDYGIALTPTAAAGDIAARAEALGFTHVWFYDTQLLCHDILVAMTAAALKTRSIKLCAGVLVPSNRLAAVAANAMASLNALAPERVVAGLGTGYTARRTMGLPAQKLKDIREYARVMRALWRGELVETELEGAPRKMQFMHPPHMPGQFVNCEAPIGVHLSAFGPKGRKLTAEIADGFINPYTNPDSLNDVARLHEACRTVNRDPASIYTTSLNLGCILAPGEAADSPRARAQAGPWPAIYWHWLVEDGDKASIPPPLAPLIEAYRRLYENYTPADARYLTLHAGHLMYLRPEEQQFITAEILKFTSLTGTADEIEARVAAMAAAGYHQMAIQLVPGQEAAMEDWAKLLIKR